MDPWELPGMIARNNKRGGGMMRDKYYLTNHTALVYYNTSSRQVRTTNGFWQPHAHDTVIRAEHDRIVGIKRTIKFHQHTGAKTNWIMNIYYSLIEGDSFCPGHHHDHEFGAPSEDTSFSSPHPRSRPMHYYPKHHSDPRLKSYMEHLGNLLFSDADPDNSAGRGDPPTADHGQSKKRKKISNVWDYFTKIFARDINGKVVTYAVCNHCCKILSGSSKNGTSQLARHACPCKFKPVAAGRNAKDSGGDINVPSS
ncbi:hypothetical protein TRIUR3_00706 [Triticum urartu]|uniref:BED-type domain-containing protein n=1 Tax=Triticum urartu TaxID=4572 RepID=M7YNN5_TRIUA|nr:hypothetical protein TRIUR3_00706 [Triticum urartu]